MAESYEQKKAKANSSDRRWSMQLDKHDKDGRVEFRAIKRNGQTQR